MDIRFYWYQDWVSQKRFRVYWNSGKVHFGYFYSKHNAAKHHQMVRPIYLNEKNSHGEISMNYVVGLRCCVDSYQGNAQSINSNKLER